MPHKPSQFPAKPHCIEFRVRTYECDSYLHVNNAVYLNYLEMARQEYLIAGGLDYEEMRRTGYGLIITEITIKYKKAAESGIGYGSKPPPKPSGPLAVYCSRKFTVARNSSLGRKSPLPISALKAGPLAYQRPSASISSPQALWLNPEGMIL
jgi:hypothetical protein